MCNVLWYVALVKVYEANKTSYRWVVGKESNILIASQVIVDVLVACYTKTHQFIGSKCLVTTWNPKPHQSTASASVYYMPLVHVYWSSLLVHLVFGMDFFFSLTKLCPIVHWSFGKILVHWVCRSSKGWHISLYNIKKKKIMLVKISTHPLSKKLWSTRKLSSSWWLIQGFQNSNFHLKAQILSPAEKYCQLLSLKWQAHFVSFWENV